MDTIMKLKYIFNYLIIAIFKVHLHHNCSCFHSPKSPQQKHSVGSKIRIHSSDDSSSWFSPIFKNLSWKNSFIIYSTGNYVYETAGYNRGIRRCGRRYISSPQATYSRGKIYYISGRIKTWSGVRPPPRSSAEG